MRILIRATLVAATTLALAGCFATEASPTATPTASPTETAATPSPAPPSASDEPTTEPEPGESDDPMGPVGEGPFTCDLPVHVDATVPLANLSATRIGEHEGYDRVVFEFIQGLPEVSIERATPPFAHDASGEPIEIEGTSFLRITMRGGTKQGADGTSTYDGASEYNPGFSMLTHLIEGGDFEAQSTWYVGLNEEACIRVLTLTDTGAPRLVIDLEG